MPRGTLTENAIRWWTFTTAASAFSGNSATRKWKKLFRNALRDNRKAKKYRRSHKATPISHKNNIQFRYKSRLGALSLRRVPQALPLCFGMKSVPDAVECEWPRKTYRPVPRVSHDFSGGCFFTKPGRAIMVFGMFEKVRNGRRERVWKRENGSAAAWAS